MRTCHVLVAAAIVLFAGGGAVSAQSPSDALSASQIAVACGPSSAPSGAPSRGDLRILGAQDSQPRALFGPRDLVVVNGGTQAGLQLGQEYFVRQPVVFGRYSRDRLRTVHTTGWVRIVAVNDTTAIALVDVVCDGVATGNYLEPFVAPAALLDSQRADSPGDLDFLSLGRVLFGDQERWIGGIGDFMLIDRGSAQGVAPGTRFAVYRDLGTAGVPLAAVGEGVIVSTADTTSLLRITTARDAIESGDYVVPRK